MPEYRIFETAEFLKTLARLPASDGRLIRRRLDERAYPQLKVEPFFGQNVRKLRGYSPEVWRYRIGRLRVFCAVDGGRRTALVLTIHLRRDAYR